MPLMPMICRHSSRRSSACCIYIYMYYTPRNYRQSCYVQETKMLSICFIQLCAPWWWTFEARNIRELVCCNVLTVIELCMLLSAHSIM